MLHCLAKRLTKTVILRELLEDWMEKQKDRESDVQLIKEIAERIKVQWKVEKAAKNPITLDTFKSLVQNELKSTGLSILYVKLILQELQ
jgi:hypothetical protein